MEHKINKKEYYSIDLTHVFSVLWKKIWIVAIFGLIGAIIGFSYSSFAIKPTYSSEIMLYVNNSSISVGSASFSISSSEISAAQSLVKTYTHILKNRTTLESVIEKSGVNYSWKQLDYMIHADSVDDTEILRVTVTSEDPYDAAKIANCIAQVLPVRIAEIIKGSSMEVVDSAVVNLNKVAPSITNHTVIAAIIGVLIALIIIVVIAISDDTIHDEEYILNKYDYPILAKIPDLYSSGSKGYTYYKRSENK